ncbi:MAG: hypothetical protein L0Y55_06875 [Anaerolineales bacterium]|nr:hypothetical protein [Anaerolineales bacterium]
MGTRRDFFAVFVLFAVCALACPLLGSLFSGSTLATIGAFSARELPTLTPTETPSATHTPTIAPTFAPPSTAAQGEPPTVTLLPRVYLLPLRRAFSVGQAQPQADAPFLLYETRSDLFQLIGQQGTNVRLQTLDGRMNFWTARENISTIPPVAAEYDYSARGKTARLVSSGFVCLHSEMPAPVFSICQPQPGFSSARVIAKITAGHIVFYLVEVNGKNYFVPPEVIASIS